MTAAKRALLTVFWAVMSLVYGYLTVMAVVTVAYLPEMIGK